MIASIDLGSSLCKIILFGKQRYFFYSQADYSLKQLKKILQKNKISQVKVTGIGKVPKEFSFLKIKRTKKSIISQEIKTQTRGLERLWKIHNQKIQKNYLLVSIGTGTSYTRVRYKSIKKIPLGNPIAGGLILGLGRKLGFNNFSEISKAAVGGNYRDIDLYFGDLIVANFAKANNASFRADLAAALMNLVAITTIKDILLYGQHQQFGRFQKVVYIGSSLRNNPYLARLLQQYTKRINKKPCFVRNGEFAGAMGAL